MIMVELYTKDDCSLCERAKQVILRVQQTIPFAYQEIFLVPGTDAEERFRNDIPVVSINGDVSYLHRVPEKEFKERLMELSRMENDA